MEVTSIVRPAVSPRPARRTFAAPPVAAGKAANRRWRSPQGAGNSNNIPSAIAISAPH
ncbi:MAG: hypothetical protein P4L83_00205 [Nevskia sp.]|nr:hypothetical protein [Nevskia sp.]